MAVPEHVVVPDLPPHLEEGDPYAQMHTLSGSGVAPRFVAFSFNACILLSPFFLGHSSVSTLADVFLFSSEAVKITDDRFPNEVAEANTVTREPSASCVAGIPLVDFCHCRTGNAGASQITHQLMPWKNGRFPEEWKHFDRGIMLVTACEGGIFSGK